MKSTPRKIAAESFWKKANETLEKKALGVMDYGLAGLSTIATPFKALAGAAAGFGGSALMSLGGTYAGNEGRTAPGPKMTAPRSPEAMASPRFANAQKQLAGARKWDATMGDALADAGRAGLTGAVQGASYVPMAANLVGSTAVGLKGAQGAFDAAARTAGSKWAPSALIRGAAEGVKDTAKAMATGEGAATLQLPYEAQAAAGMAGVGDALSRGANAVGDKIVSMASKMPGASTAVNVAGSAAKTFPRVAEAVKGAPGLVKSLIPALPTPGALAGGGARLALGAGDMATRTTPGNVREGVSATMDAFSSKAPTPAKPPSAIATTRTSKGPGVLRGFSKGGMELTPPTKAEFIKIANVAVNKMLQNYGSTGQGPDQHVPASSWDGTAPAFALGAGSVLSSSAAHELGKRQLEQHNLATKTIADRLGILKEYGARKPLDPPPKPPETFWSFPHPPRYGIAEAERDRQWLTAAKPLAEAQAARPANMASSFLHANNKWTPLLAAGAAGLGAAGAMKGYNWFKDRFGAPPDRESSGNSMAGPRMAAETVEELYPMMRRAF